MIIGTCSICTGAVTVPDVWMCIIPPTPTCSSCGAVSAAPHGPVIPMAPKRTMSNGAIKKTSGTANDY